MRKLVLACCFVASPAMAMSVPPSQVIGTINTNVDVACQSATTIAGQAQQAGVIATRKASSATDRIGKYCSRAGTRLAQAGALLDIVNTAASTLLTTAGAMGVKLPGVPGLK